MKRFLCYGFLCSLFFLWIPFLVYQFTKPTPVLETSASTQSAEFAIPQEISVFLTHNDEIVTMSLEECVAAVLSTDDAPLEALKAQAVAIRSYLLYQIHNHQQTPPPAHPSAMLCGDSNHCMAFSLNTADDSVLKQQAILETAGQYLAYNHLPARCFFFHVSAGKTESASDVWGGDFPYLISVDSPMDELSAAYQSRVFYPTEAFLLTLKGVRNKLDIDARVLGEVQRSTVGHVKSVILYDETFSGEEIQKLFHLKSTNFTIHLANHQVVFHVKGDGHGVGMSLFGAAEMAKNGADYLSILSHYYPETVLAQG